MGKLEGKVVVITGASSGIGRAAALRFAGSGAVVVLIARNGSSLEEVARECRGRGGTALVLPGDVSDHGWVQEGARLVIETFGRIDAWINGAAVTAFGRVEELPPETVRRVVEVGLLGYINGAQAVIPIFREQGKGILINISSIAAYTAEPYAAPYAAVKAAVDSLSRSLRMELRDAPGIHVCTLHVSSTDTPLFEHAANYAGYKAKPLSPVFSPDQAARVLARLVSRPCRDAYSEPLAAVAKCISGIPVLGESLVARQIETGHFLDEAAAITTGNLFEPMPLSNRVEGGWQGRRGSPAAGIAVACAVAALAGLAWSNFRRM